MLETSVPDEKLQNTPRYHHLKEELTTLQRDADRTIESMADQDAIANAYQDI